MEGRGREREGKEGGKRDGVGGGREGEKEEKKRRERQKKLDVGYFLTCRQGEV